MPALKLWFHDLKSISSTNEMALAITVPWTISRPFSPHSFSQAMTSKVGGIWGQEKLAQPRNAFTAWIEKMNTTPPTKPFKSSINCNKNPKLAYLTGRVISTSNFQHVFPKQIIMLLNKPCQLDNTLFYHCQIKDNTA